MFVVMKGTVAISIGGKLVERVGPGGVFGEMALVERSPRLASASAETDCVLLGVHRNAFLALIQNRPDFAITLLGAIGERAKFVTSQLR
jgi:CRP/FNR family transcriptional regulator, cyclic AMP receptor protein